MKDTNNESSNILDIENKAFSALQKCKIAYKNYKKAYMTYFRFVESGVKTVEMVGDNLTTSNVNVVKKVVAQSKTLSGFMKTLEIKFDKAYNEFISLDKNSISISVVRKVDHIYDEMNDAKESFNSEINKILVYNDFLEHGKDLDNLEKT